MGKKIYLLALITLVLCVSLVACENKKETLRIGYIPIIDCTQLYVAKENDFFEEEGLNVELKKFKGGSEIIDALMSGDIDIAFSNVVSVLYARQKGLPIKILTGGPTTDRHHIEAGILSLKSGSINSLSDLKGSTIAVNTRGNIVELFVTEMLIKNNVNPKDVTFVAASFAEMYSLLKSEKVNAIATVEPHYSNAKRDNDVLDLGDYFTDTLEKVQISTYNIKSGEGGLSTPKAMQFKRAITRVSKFIENNNNRQNIMTSIAAHTQLSLTEVEKMTLPIFSADVDLDSLKNVNKLMLKEATNRHSIDLDKLVEK